MKKEWKLCLICIILLMLFISVQLKQSQAVAFKFDNVVPFATVTGVMGLFNQNDGKVYLYDGNFQNCVSVLQLEELGKAMKPVENKQ